MFASGLPTSSAVLGTVVLVAAALVCMQRAFSSPGSPRPTSPATSPAASQISSGTAREQPDQASLFRNVGRQRIAVGLAAGFVVLLLTRWLALGVSAAVLVVIWGRLVRDHRADDERRRIEAIAKWLEDLRDTLRGSSVGAEEALEQVAQRPPEAIREALSTFVFRRRQGMRTEDALADLAESLHHPTADAAIAAIRLVVSGAAGAGRLYPTVDALAAAARDEVSARERVDRTRTVYQSSMKRLIVIGIVLIAYLRLAAGDLLNAYNSPAGQMFLLLPLSMWAGCIVWLRSLCRYDEPNRYRIVTADDEPSTPTASAAPAERSQAPK